MSSTYLQHPLSAAFPPMSEEDHAKLTADILAYGQREPIALFEAMILDGWHRYLSCLKIGDNPEFRSLDDDIDPVAFVISRNLHRRHLTVSQRAEAVAACSEWVTVGRPSNTAPSAGLTTRAMAKMADVGIRTMEYAKATHAAGLSEAVRYAKITVKQGAAIAKLPKDQQEAAVEDPDILRLPKTAPEPATVDEPEKKEEAGPKYLHALHEIERLKTELAESAVTIEELSRTIEERDNKLAVALAIAAKVDSVVEQLKVTRVHMVEVQLDNRNLMACVEVLELQIKSQDGVSE
jgi:hypothetical protein